MAENQTKKANQLLFEKRHIIDTAMGRVPANLVLKNADYVNVFTNQLCRADIAIAEGVIVGTGVYHGTEEVDCSGQILLPGLIDAHIHLESALVSPEEFARAVLPHGTTSIVADPHEIANVMGEGGIDYMLQATEGLPVDVRFMLPSCVPATPLDESGATLDDQDICRFYRHPRVLGLAEMMNFVGVLKGDEQPLRKIVSAQDHGMRIDGHAPDIQDRALNAYIASGVYSDHECHDLSDAMAKLERGQFIMIREGTAARNLKALVPLLRQPYASQCMFCTDDKHPNDLLEQGHMDFIVRKAIALGADPILAVKAATYHAAWYFGLNGLGAIAPGYRGDLVVIDSFQDFNVNQVYKNGRLAAKNGMAFEFPSPVIEPRLLAHARSTFHIGRLSAENFATQTPRGVIGMINGEITTEDRGYAQQIEVEKDVLKIALVERHRNTGHIGIGFIQGYGLKSGAVATSISHDSHNMIVVGTSEADMAAAANRTAELNGGIVVWKDGKPLSEVPLAMAGIMSDEPLTIVNEKLEGAKVAAYQLGVNRKIDPFMTLSFMALPVIPSLRITTQGIFDVNRQAYL